MLSGKKLVKSMQKFSCLATYITGCADAHFFQLRVYSYFIFLVNLAYISDMLNHLVELNWFFHWCFENRMLEVVMNAEQQIQKGDEIALGWEKPSLIESRIQTDCETWPRGRIEILIHIIDSWKQPLHKAGLRLRASTLPRPQLVGVSCTRPLFLLIPDY